VQQIKSCRRQLHRPNKLTPSSALAGLVLKIDVRQRLRVAILHDEAGDAILLSRLRRSTEDGEQDCQNAGGDQEQIGTEEWREVGLTFSGSPVPRRCPTSRRSLPPSRWPSSPRRTPEREG